MRSLNLFFIAFLLLITGACTDDDANPDSEEPTVVLQFPAPDTYAPSDSLAQLLPEIHESWNVVYANDGGIAGPEVIPFYDRLIFKPNQIYGLEKDGVLIEHGFVRVIPPDSLGAVEIHFNGRAFSNQFPGLDQTGHYVTMSEDGAELFFSSVEIVGRGIVFERD